MSTYPAIQFKFYNYDAPLPRRSLTFHNKCINKWLKLNSNKPDIIYFCNKCGFIGFNDNDLSYKPLIYKK